MEASAHILVADEQSLCREGLSTLLGRALGIAPVEVETFGALIRLLSGDHPVAMAIVDLDLPGLNGAIGIRRMRDYFPHVRLVVMGAVLERDVIVECLGAGVHGCIAKSLPSDEIGEALQTVAKGRIYVPATLTEKMPGPPAQEDSKLLSDRQREVLDILATGKSNKEIARELGIAEGTVKVHVNAVFRTLGVRNRICAVAALREIERNPPLCEPMFPGMLHPYRRAGDLARPARRASAKKLVREL